MSAREFDELLSAYLDGEVTPEERAAVERRLEQSPALRETLDELSEVGDLLRSLPPARPPVDLPDRVVAAIGKLPPAMTTGALHPRRHGLWPRLAGWPLAAGVLVAAGVMIVVLLPQQAAVNEQVARSSPPPAAGAPAGGIAGGSAENSPRLEAYAVDPRTSEPPVDSLTGIVRRLNRMPAQGEVLNTLVSNAGQTQVLRYTVVDTSVAKGQLKTILADNNFDVVVTDTPIPAAVESEGLAAAGDNGRQWFFLIEGSPEQVGETLKQIETSNVVSYTDDFGVPVVNPAELQDEYRQATQQSRDLPAVASTTPAAASPATSSTMTLDATSAARPIPAPAAVPPAPADAENLRKQAPFNPPPAPAADFVRTAPAAEPKPALPLPAPAAPESSPPQPADSQLAEKAPAKPQDPAPAIGMFRNAGGPTDQLANQSLQATQRGVSAELDANLALPVVNRLLGETASGANRTNDLGLNFRPPVRRGRLQQNSTASPPAVNLSQGAQPPAPGNATPQDKPVQPGDSVDRQQTAAAGKQLESKKAVLEASQQESVSRALIILQASPEASTAQPIMRAKAKN